LLLIGTSQRSGINLGDFNLPSFDNTDNFKSAGEHHFFIPSAPFVKGLALISEFIDAEEKEDSLEDKKPTKKQALFQDNFSDSAAYFFGYISDYLSRQASQDFVNKARYLLLKVFRL